MPLNATDLSILNLDTDNDGETDQENLKELIYPIVGCVVSALCIIGIAAFFLSHRKCRKRTPKDTESEILKQKHDQDKKNAANTSLTLYNLDEKPVYTAITQQEDNEIADEVRESYKNISQNVNTPILCCPNDKSSYSYFPKQNIQGVIVEKETSNEPQCLAGNLNSSERDFDNDSITSHPTHVTSKYDDNNVYDRKYDQKIDKEHLETSYESDSASIISEWTSLKQPKQNHGSQYGISAPKNLEHDASLKTNFDIDFEEVESILTSVSRMDKKRIEKLRDSEFYKGLKYDRKALNLSVDSIDLQSNEDSGKTFSSVEEKQKNYNRDKNDSEDCVDDHFEIYETENKNQRYETTEENDEEEDEDLLAEWKNISKRSLKKPLQYIDKDSESFFKTVQPTLNPDEFSESDKTKSEQFKRSERGIELGTAFLESPLSTNTYSYDKGSHFIIIDSKKKKHKNNSKILTGNSSIPYDEQSSHKLKIPIRGSSTVLADDVTTGDTLDDLEELVANLSYDDDASVFSLDTNESKMTSKQTRNSDIASSEGTSLLTQNMKNRMKKGPTILTSERNFKTYNEHDSSYSSTSSTNSAPSSFLRSDVNLEKIIHRTTPKYKSARGNLSAYISSRQSATKTKIQKNELTKSFSNATVSTLKAQQRGKIRQQQSPARRMFQSRFLTKQNTGRLKHSTNISTSLNGTL